MVPSSRSLRSHSALLALNSARERAYSAAVASWKTRRSLPASKLSQTGLLMPRVMPVPGSVKSRIVIIARDFMETHGHVEPGPDPLAAVDGARFERRYDFGARHVHHDGSQPT